MGKFFLKKNFTSHVHIQNDQRVMGIILRYVCWGTHRPPPGGPAADRPTRRPPRFGSTKGGGGVPPPPSEGGGGPPPPPTAPQTVEHPSGSHIGWRQPPCKPIHWTQSLSGSLKSLQHTPPPPCNSYALVIATVGVGTVLIWYLILIRYNCSAAA